MVISSTSIHTLSHTTLGPITGLLTTSSTLQFRSIPFATIPSRFRQSRQCDGLGEKRNFSTYGPACPQPVGLNDGSSGGPFEGEAPLLMDEKDCLNLTITAPLETLEKPEDKESEGLLPVMVYIHGGALKTGSGHVGALHDTSRMVALSVAQKTPVIIVNIHYRLHFLGFLTSHDLVAHSKSLDPPEHAGNYGLHDQRVAFSWLHSHLHGFGGDPTNITVFGESAGAWSISYHMCSSPIEVRDTASGTKVEIRPFRRAILQSPIPAMCAPLKDHEVLYQRVLSFLGISNDDPRRLEKLLAVPVSEIVAASEELGLPHMLPLADEFLFPVFPNSANQGTIIRACDWVEELIIGDNFYEGFLFQQAMKSTLISDFIDAYNTLLGNVNASYLLTAYGITADMNKNLFLAHSTLLIGDLVFSQPAHALIDALARPSPSHLSSSKVDTALPAKKKIFRYTLTARNPFSGSMYSQIPGHHFLDKLFLFLTLKERYPSQRYTDIAEGFASRWINFANGKDPWEEYCVPNSNVVSESEKSRVEGKIAVISGSEGWVVRSRLEDESISEGSEEGPRRYEQWKAIARVLGGFHDEWEVDRARNVMMGLAGWAAVGGLRWDVKQEKYVHPFPSHA